MKPLLGQLVVSYPCGVQRTYGPIKRGEACLFKCPRAWKPDFQNVAPANGGRYRHVVDDML